MPLAAYNDSIAEAVDSHIELLRATRSSPQLEQSPAAGTTTRCNPVDTQPFRRQIRSILRSSRYNEYSYSYGYGYASDIVEQVRELLQQAEGFSQAATVETRCSFSRPLPMSIAVVGMSSMTRMANLALFS
ncbi:MAG: hypothetical protein MI924_35790 [Chloroflexales bacterium]|nr:hypothetical protein [Chloroflexales bacterium]